MFNDLWYRMRSLLRRSAVEGELDEELRFHIEQSVRRYVDAGLTHEEAQQRARLEFGGIERAKEECRDARGVRFIETLIQDVRFGLRMLRKNLGFPAIAVITLALGMGANTAIFSVVNTVLLRSLPYKDADRLVTVWGDNRSRGYDTDLVSPLDFAVWRSQNRVFWEMAASTDVQYTLTGSGEPAAVIGYSFSADYFHVLGTAPLLGRTFLHEEEEPGKNHVTVLSYSFWQKRFGGDSNVIEKNIILDGAPYAFWFKRNGHWFIRAYSGTLIK